jgi:hypothetical protein
VPASTYGHVVVLALKGREGLVAITWLGDSGNAAVIDADAERALASLRAQ